MKMGTCGIPVEPKLPKLQHKIQQEYLISQEMWGNISWSRVEMKMGVCGIPVVPILPHKIPQEDLIPQVMCCYNRVVR